MPESGGGDQWRSREGNVSGGGNDGRIGSDVVTSSYRDIGDDNWPNNLLNFYVVPHST